MATVTVNISATDNMSPVIAALQAQLNQLQQSANINLGGRMGQSANQMMNYTTRLFENMLNSLGTKLWKQFTNNLKGAYEEIKAIDDELVVVRRVTGKTSKELEGMSKNAMKVAQTYGVSASKYLSGVADFTRAGYKDQAEGLAELSVKLQRSGDVSADVANQYILAIDKAYGLQGNIEALTAAMDGANQIGNEYATNVAEISAGMGKIATIASTAHIGINELTAALGTITAVTQRSGTEAATALRAIFLNIMGDTTTEIEDGAKWTAGEIEGLRDVLELYAPEVVRAAEATGTLINPMEAIGALAKSYQAGILTESKLFSMVNDIGGKLRTNQLMVLIKNWDMYESMLNTFANASGSIDKEVQNSLDSITVKTERLKASWVALVNDTVSTSMIKNALDGLNGMVQAVGNLGNALAIVLGLVASLKAQRLGTLFGGMFGGSAAQIATLTSAFRGIGLAVTAVGAALSIANGIIQNHNANMEKMAGTAQTQSKAALNSSNEIVKLYAVYASATAGSKEYETALRALAEALGLTAEQAKNAGSSIEELTSQQLQQAVADTKQAMVIWSNANEGKWRQKSYNILFGGEGFADTDIAAIVNKYYDLMSQYATDAWKDDYTIGASWTLSAKADAESLVASYEYALKMQQDLNAYGLAHGIDDMTDMPAYDVLTGYIADMKDAYASAKEVVDAYTLAVVNAQIQTLTATTDIAKANADLADGTADAFNADQITAFGEAIDNVAKTFDRTTFLGDRQYSAFMQRMAELFPNLIKASKEFNEWMGTNSDASKSTDKATDSVKKLAEALSTATKAKQAFDAAMSQGAENEGFKNYQDAYAAYAEEMKAGRVNSRKAMAAAQYLMAGSDLYNFDALYQAGGYKAVNKAMSNMPFKTLYGGENNEYGEGFLNALSKLAKGKNGEIKLNDKVVASYKKVGEQVDLTVEDLWGLADALDISPDQVWKSIEALSVYGEVNSDVGRVKKTLQELGKTAGVTSDEFDNLTIDYEKMLQYARQSGMNEQQWGGLKQWLYKLNELGEAQILNVPDVEGGWQNYADLTKDAAEKAKEAEGSAKEAEESMGAAAEAAEGTEAPAIGTGSATVADPAQSMYDEYNRVLTEIDKLIASKDYTITFNADGWPAIHTIEALETESGEVTRERTIQFNADGAVIYTLDVMKNKAGEVAETRTINYKANGEIESIDVVKTNAQDPNIVDHLVYYYTDGQVDHIDLLRTNAADPSFEHHEITYFTNGQIDHIEILESNAEDPSKNQHIILYYTDGKVDHLEWVEETASGAFASTQFLVHYGTDGSIQGLEKVETTANGETEKTIYELKFGADGAILEAKVKKFKVFANGETSDPVEYTLTAEDGPAFTTIEEILAYLEDNYDGQTADYDLGADPEGVNDGIETAETAIENSLASTDTTYHLKADYDTPLKNPLSIFTDYNPWNPKSPLHTGGVDPTKGHSLSEMFAGINQATQPTPQKNILTELNRALQEAMNGTAELSLYPKDSTGSTHWDAPTGEEKVYIHPKLGPVDSNGNYIYPEERTIEAELEVTPDKASAEEAAEEAQKIASLTLGASPVPFIPEEGYDGEYAGQWEGNDVYTVSFEVENEGVFDDIMYIDKESGKPHVISIQTAGDGAQTITETVYTLDGLVESQNVITVDADGNAETNITNITELLDLIDKTFSLSVNANTSDAQSRLNRIRNTLDEIKSKTVTVTTKYASTGNSGGSGGAGGSSNNYTGQQVAINAKGTDYFKGGYSLINEEGPELVAGNGLAQIYAHGFPTIAKIPRGARIYNARETAQLLGGTMSLPAYASGTNNSNVNSDFAKGMQAALNFLSTGSTTSMSDITGGNVGPTDAHLTIPKNTKEEEKKEEEKKSSGGGGSSRKSEQEEKAEEDEDEFWDTIKEYIDYGLKKIQYQIDDYQDDITAIERARDALLKPIEEELEDLDYSLSMLQYEVTLLERARDDAVKPLDKEIERLEKARDLSKEEYDLEEKRKALEDARHQRTIRYFNEESGQWEWMADQQAIQEAEKAYNDALADHEIAMLKRERDAIYDSFQEQIDAFEEQEETLERRQEDLEHEKTKIEYEYGESIDPIQDQLDALQQTYDDLDKYYQRLVDAVEVPMESLTAALKEMASAGKGYTAQLANTTQLLDALYSLAPTWSAVGLTDIGKYVPDQRQYGGTGAGVGKIDQSTNVYVEKMQIEGNDAKTIGDILKKSKLYSERR